MLFPSTPLSTMQRRTRPAFTLLELVVVLAVLGVMAAAVGSLRPAPQLAQRLSVKQETQFMLCALRAARATAIATAQPVELNLSQGKESTTLSTRVAAYPSDRQPPAHSFPSFLKAAWSTSRVAFQPDGSSDQSLVIVLAGPDGPSYVLEVLSASGQVTMVIKE